MGKKRVTFEELKKGMIVADDVYTLSNMLIIQKKSIVNEKMLSKLRMYNIPALNVMDIANDSALSSDDDVRVMTQTEKLRATDDFKFFRKEFSAASAELEKCLRRAASSGMSLEDLDIIKDITDKMLDNSLKLPHIFDMLHAMRDSSDSVYSHSINVAVISAVLGKWLRFSAQDQQLLAMAGMLHDIGKLLIPENILHKAYKLTDKEYEIIKSHTVKGYHLVKSLSLDAHMKYVVLMHHERCDGSGYPTGIKGDKIDKYAKIAAIADVYDAMTSSRVYRDMICPFDVIDNFEKDGLQLYETEYIMTFLKNIANTYIHSQVRLSNDVVGEIIMLNSNKLAKPVIKAGRTFIDLSKEPDLKIDEIL